MVGERAIDGWRALTLGSRASGGIEAAFVPAAGMVGCSLLHRGEELLGQRGGLRRYVEERSTMGIPLLYPWANRVARKRFAVAGREVDLDRAAPAPSLDPAGLPIHGLLSAAGGWRVVSHEPDGDGGVLSASFDFGAGPSLLPAFPFPHELLFGARLQRARLTITTTVVASGATPVPISFGFHPYLRLPDVRRDEWEIEVPVTSRLRLDHLMLPTGEQEPAHVEGGRLGPRTFDDGFLAPPDGAPFVLAGGGRRIELAFGAGYPFAQVYAPADDDVIAYEPMTAPTNALVEGGPELRVLEPGERYAATFAVSVSG